MSKTQKLAMHITPESIAAMIAERCYQDAAFRQKLLANPRDTLEDAMGDQQLPEDLEMILQQNDDKHWYIPVPNVRENQQLSEEQLEKVAAGEVGFAVVFTGAVLSALLTVGVLGGLKVANKI